MKCIEIPEDTINKHTFIPEKYNTKSITAKSLKAYAI